MGWDAVAGVADSNPTGNTRDVSKWHAAKVFPGGTGGIDKVLEGSAVASFEGYVRGRLMIWCYVLRRRFQSCDKKILFQYFKTEEPR